MPGNLKKVSAKPNREGRGYVQRQLKSRQIVVPNTYPFENPLPLPLRTDLTICGNQMDE